MPDQPNPDAVDVWFVKGGIYVEAVMTVPGVRPQMYKTPKMGYRIDHTSVLEQLHDYRPVDDEDFAIIKTLGLDKLPDGHGVLSDALRQPVDLREGA